MALCFSGYQADVWVIPSDGGSSWIPVVGLLVLLFLGPVFVGLALRYRDRQGR
jgi:hypothetical protein